MNADVEGEQRREPPKRPGNAPIRILLADDHTVMRAGTKRILEDEPDFVVVGEAADGFEAVQQGEEIPADVMLLDISMPGMDGVKACRMLRQRCPDLRILVLTGYESEAFVRALYRVGVDGYLLKSADPADLVGAIRAVVAGEQAFAEPIARMLEEGTLPSEGAPPTAKELAVLRAVAAGARNRDIAQSLGMSVNTVEFHLKNLYTKLGATSRADAVVRAQWRGWLDIQEPLC